MSEVQNRSEIRKLCAGAGFPELLSATDEELHNYIIPSCITAFSDGEVDVKHPAVDGIRAERYGSEISSKGAFTTRLAYRAARGELIDLQRYIGEYLALASAVIPGRYVLPESAVGVGRQSVMVDGVQVPTRQAISDVVELGPGLAGRRHIRERIGLAQSGYRPFAYTAVNKGPFVGSYLQTTAKISASEAHVVDNGVTCFDDGMRVSIGRMPDASADVVICSGLHKVVPEELHAGFAGLKRVLRDGGMVVIRAIAQAGDGETDACQMIELARGHGFASPILQHETSVMYSTVYNGWTRQKSRSILNAVIVN